MKKYLMTLLTLGLACNAAACMEDEPFYDTEIPPHASIDNSKGEGVTRLVTYNVGIFNKYIKDDYQLIADMMKEIDADAICMNELDNNTNRTRHVYQLKHFASLMGSWDFEYGAAMPYDGGEYGEGVTTRKKAVNKFSVALPKGVGAEPRVLVVMEMEDYVICTSHLDHVSSEAQLGQVELITKTMKERYGDSGKPVFLGGDMNAVGDGQTAPERLGDPDHHRIRDLPVGQSLEMHRLHHAAQGHAEVRSRRLADPALVQVGRRDESL